MSREYVKAAGSVGRLKKYFGSSNPFSLSTYLGGALGAGIGFTAGLLAYGLEEGASVLPYVIAGNYQEIPKVLASDVDKAYKVASEFAVFGSIAGTVITRRLKKWFFSLLK